VFSRTRAFGCAPFQQLDDLEVIQVRLRNRIVASLDIAVVGGEIQGRLAALVREVDVGAALDQQPGQPIVPVVDGREERRPPILGLLVDVRVRVEERACRVDVALARGKDERRQAAPTGTHETAYHDGVIVSFRHGRRVWSWSRRQDDAALCSDHQAALLFELDLLRISPSGVGCGGAPPAVGVHARHVS
jgi:hypothetical protein